MESTRRKNPLKKSTVVKIAVVSALVVAAITALVLVLRSQVSEQFGKDDEQEVVAAQVAKGNISTTVSGSGTLANEESEDTFISATVDVTEVYVKAGENVKKGDMLASVNGASVVKAMKEVQDGIDALDEKIAALEGEEVDSAITAGVDGRVEKVYASAGSDVADVMYEHSALMLMSVDGYLAVDVKSDKLAKGDSVTVKVAGGTEYEGAVDAVWSGNATVLVPDDSAAFDAKATVWKGSSEIGSGTLYIHEQLAVTGFTGTVSSVDVSEGDYVYTGDTLLTLADASSAVNYATLLKQRADLEDELQDLIVIHKEGAVYAQENGLVTAITETEDSKTTTTTAVTSSSRGSSSSGSSSQGATQTTVTESSDAEDGTTISLCPTDSMTVALSIDEADVLSLEVGQTAAVTISSLGDDTYTATITDLDTVGTSSDGVTTYTATLTLDKTEGMLDGMSATAVIVIEGKENALLVPVEAVHQTRSTSYVYTSYNEDEKEFGDMVEVVCGLSNSEYTEISSGLSEGDTVYYTESEEEEERSRFGGGMGGMSGPGEMGGGRSDGRSGGRSDGRSGGRSDGRSGGRSGGGSGGPPSREGGGGRPGSN